MSKKTRDPVEDAFWGCVGPILVVGMAFGAVLVGVIWGLVELFQWML